MVVEKRIQLIQISYKNNMLHVVEESANVLLNNMQTLLLHVAYYFYMLHVVEESANVLLNNMQNIS